MRSQGLAALFFAMAVSAAPVQAATLIEREFHYSADRFAVDAKGGVTDVRVEGATRDFTPGRPDLPWVGERVEIPGQFRVAGVEVLSIETAPLAEHAMLATTIKPSPGLGPMERTAADPEYFSKAGFQPSDAVRLGTQGWMRGRNLAALEICPVRWNATTGALERVVSVKVRLSLEPGFDAPIPRERIVPEWEEPGFGGAPRGASSIEAKGPITAQPFSATQIPSLLGSPVAYVIITNDAMAPQFQRLADWKTQTGVPAVVRTLSFIQQNYPQGSDDAERIRAFIKDAYSRWGTKWILLGGDTDILPPRFALDLYGGGDLIPCDLYFSCLDGNWNGDGDANYGEGYNNVGDPGDNADLMPEVWVGRAPTSTVANAQQFVDKTFQYIRTPVGDYENSILFFAEVLFPETWQQGQGFTLDGAQLVEDVLPSVHFNPGVRYARLYQNYTWPNYEPGALPESKAVVLDSLDRGYNVSVHVGHGYRNVMSVGDANMDNGDAEGITNGNRLTNLYAINCTSNAIDFPCIGEAFLHATGGGAVTNIGSSRVDYPVVGRYFENEYFKLVYHDSVTAVGEAQAKQKLPFVSSSTRDGLNRWTEQTLLLLGDPELRIYTSLPRILNVTHPASIALSESTITVNVKIGATPLYGARVTAYKPGDEYRTGTTNGAGNIVLPFRADNLGSFTLTVTAFNCKPYQATVNLTAAALPVLGELASVVDDDNVGGTQGDSDGFFDAGEVIDLHIPVKNSGGSSAPSVNGTLTSTDGLLTISSPTVNYGTIGAGATSNPAAGFRISTGATTPDQHEFAMLLTLVDTGGHSWTEPVQVVLHGPDLRHYGHRYVDSGNANGVPDPGETVNYFVKLRNLGTGGALQVTAVLRNYDGLATVTDSTASWGTLAPGQEAEGDAMVFNASSSNAKLQLRVSDQYGLIFTQTVDIIAPDAPFGIGGQGFANSIRVEWGKSIASDLFGYNLYRSLSSGGPFVKINPVPTDRISYYLDSPLASLTVYYYQVSAVDSSGNESELTGTAILSTTPPLHSIFPIGVALGTPAPVAIEHIYPGYPLDIVVGADKVYLWHADGYAPVDADGGGATSGDFSVRGSYFPAGPSVADLNHDGSMEIIAPSWDSTATYVFDTAGQLKPGWPNYVSDAIWSGVAVGDLNHDGSSELVFGSNGNKIYAYRANGQEWINGDNNASTKGVFKVLGAGFNYSTPALADLDGDGNLDIIYAGGDNKLYAWKMDGTNLPGFPITLPGTFTASPAIGYLDGPGDSQLDIVVPTGAYVFNQPQQDSLYAFRANGQRRPGWPVHVSTTGNSKTPSPALADMDNDGFVDVVFASNDGGIYVYDRNGVVLPGFNNVRYSPSIGGASESSPVVADINGDGRNDIVMGDENSRLVAIDGMTQTILPGFPITVEAEVKGTPALCDCDGDGMTEIVLSGWDKKVYVWDYDYPFSPGVVPPWPQFHHDAARTGLLTNPVWVGVGDPPATSVPKAIEFEPIFPNPAQGRSGLTWAVPADRAGSKFELGVYDLSGRRVQRLDHGVARVGRHSAVWNLRDEKGTPANPGVYFIRLTIGSESLTRKLAVLH